MKKKNLMHENKAKEAQAAPMAMEQASVPQAEKFDFEVWYAMRSARIPGHHMKEILKADFMARGCENEETLEDFDKALREYGVKLG